MGDYMKYAIDRIEEDIVILEDIKTKEKKEVNVCLLPSSIYEGMILVYKDGRYLSDLKTEEERRREILERFMRLRNRD